MVDSTLRLDIDARGAKDGAREFSRSADSINQKANQTARSADRVEGSFSRLRGTVGALSGAFAALGGALAIREFTRLADTATQLESRLRLVTNSADQLARTQKRLFEISQQARTGFEGTVQLYARLDRATQDLGLKQQELFEIVQTVNQAITVSGASATEAQAALFQLSQGLASGALRGEELNSVLEQTPRLARAIADGANIAFGDLRKLAAEGQITAELVTKALLKSADQIQVEFGNVERTAGQAFTQLRNQLIQSVGRIDENTDATSELVGAIDRLRQIVASQAFSDGVSVIINLVSTLANTGAAAVSVVGRLADNFGRLQDAVAGTRRSGGGLENPFKDFQDFFDALSRLATAADRQVQVNRISDTLEQLENVRREIRQLESVDNLSDSQQFRLDQLQNRLVGLQKTYDRLTESVSDNASKTKEAADAADTTSVSMADLNKVLAFSEQAFKATASGADDTTSAFQNVTESLRQEIELVGATREERRLSNALRQAGADLTEEQRQRIVALVGELESERDAQERANRALEQAIQPLDQVAGVSSNAADALEDTADQTRDLGIEAESTADIMRGAFEEVGRSIQSGIADALRGAGGDLVDQAKNIAANLAAAFATQRIIIPAFIQPVAGALGLGGGSSGAQQQGAVPSVGSIGNAASGASLLSNIGSGLTTPTFSAEGVANFAPSVFGTGGTELSVLNGGAFGVTNTPNSLATGISNLSTPLGIGGGLIGGLASSLVFENNLGNTIGSTVGGLGGGLAGSALLGGAVGGPVGAGIGALIGAFGGGGLGSLFGNSTPANSLLEFENISVQNGRLRGLADTKDADSEEGRKFAQALQQSIGQAQSITGSAFTDTSLKNISSQLVDERDPRTELKFRDRNEADRVLNALQNADIPGVSDAAGRTDDPTNIRVSRDAGDFEAVLRAILTPEAGLLEDIGDNVAKVIGTSTANSVEDLLSDIQFAAGFEDRIEALNSGVQSLSDTISGQAEQNLDNLATSVGDFLDKTQELELGIGKAESASAEFLKRQLGIADAVDPEQLSAAAQQQIRLQTTLGQITDPTSEFRAVLDRVGISAKDAAEGVREQIQANAQQRRAGLLLQREGLGQQGQNLLGLATDTIPTLRGDLENNIIGRGLFQDTIETQFRPVVQDLSEGEIKDLINVFEGLKGQVSNADIIVQGLTDTLKGLSDSAEQATQGLSAQEVASLRVGNTEIFGPQNLNTRIQAQGLAGTNVADVLQGAQDRIANDNLSQSGAQKLANDILDVAKNSENASAAISLLNDALAESQSEAQQTAKDRFNKLRDQFVDARRKEISALEDQRSAVQERISTIRDEISAVQDSISTFQRLGDRLRDAQQSLQLSDTLSGIPLQQRVGIAENRFQDVRSRALEGDEQALRRLPEVGQSFLDVSRQFNASSGAFASDAASVRSALEKAQDVTDQETELAQKQLTTLQDDLGIQRDHLARIDRMIEKQEELIKTVREGDASNAKAIRRIASALADSNIVTQQELNKIVQTLERQIENQEDEAA